MELIFFVEIQLIVCGKKRYSLKIKTSAMYCKGSHVEVFLSRFVLKICSKFTGERPCLSVTLIKLLCNFIEIAFRHGRSPINFLNIFRTPFPRNTSVWLLLVLQSYTRLAWPNLTSWYEKILHTWQLLLVMKISTMSFAITAVFSVLNEIRSPQKSVTAKTLTPEK